MNYNKGFSDAVELFEETINRALKDDYVNDEQTIDSIIATLYVAKLQASIQEEEYVESLEQQYNEHMNLSSSCGIDSARCPNREEF